MTLMNSDYTNAFVSFIQKWKTDGRDTAHVGAIYLHVVAYDATHEISQNNRLKKHSWIFTLADWKWNWRKTAEKLCGN